MNKLYACSFIIQFWERTKLSSSSYSYRSKNLQTTVIISQKTCRATLYNTHTAGTSDSDANNITTRKHLSPEMIILLMITKFFKKEYR